jgi:endo-alpha-1,4-polygalactosaminidase (GH114 family)
VYPQNADELLDRPKYLAAVDGIGRKDLLYGEAGDGKRNDRASIADSVAHLRRLARAGKPILAVEYGVAAASAVAELRALGIATLCPLVVTGRALDALPA